MSCYKAWHGIKQSFNVCLEKSVQYYLYTQSKFICISYRWRITSETTIKEILYMFNGRHTRLKYKLLKKMYAFCWQEVLKISCNMWAVKILLKDNSSCALKKSDDFGLQHFTKFVYLLLFRLRIFRASCDFPWCEIISQNITPDVRPLWRLIMHSGAFTGKAFNMNANIMVP